ncbi:MAG: signal peptidase II [Firmicutes bacterium HGW-Firmicutes-12]|jgi:signal peptidase II|nr:MAG: signal peptidase II [Firmicutes bacterium HGW-Firmicutes-12]
MLFWIIAIVVLILDRGVKFLVTAYMELGQTIPVIKGFFHITFVKNPGAAFGILTDKKWFFIIVTIVVLILLFYLVYTIGQQSAFLSITIGLVAGGAMGNLIDRIHSGLVVDYLDFRGIWPYVFNIADSAIVIGVILLSWQLIRSEVK